MKELKYRVVYYPIAGIIDILHYQYCATVENSDHYLNIHNEFELEMSKLGVDHNMNPHVEQLVGG